MTKTIKRSKAANRLLGVYANRKRVKKLVGYPDVISARVSFAATNATATVEISDDKNLTKITGLLNREVPASVAKIDASKPSATIRTTVTQSGAAWGVDDISYKVSFSDGSSVKRTLTKPMSGDGTESPIALNLTDSIPAPDGWLKLSN